MDQLEHTFDADPRHTREDHHHEQQTLRGNARRGLQAAQCSYRFPDCLADLTHLNGGAAVTTLEVLGAMVGAVMPAVAGVSKESVRQCVSAIGTMEAMADCMRQGIRECSYRCPEWLLMLPVSRLMPDVAIHA